MRVCDPRDPDDHVPQLADGRALIVRVDGQPREGAVRVDETRFDFQRSLQLARRTGSIAPHQQRAEMIVRRRVIRVELQHPPERRFG
jgi:hypothetical protein